MDDHDLWRWCPVCMDREYHEHLLDGSLRCLACGHVVEVEREEEAQDDDRDEGN